MLQQPASLASHPPFNVGSWRVEPRDLRINRDDTTRTMKRKTMALLVVLAQHRGVVLTNQELIDALWAGEFMTEGMLEKTVSELRQLLDDIATTPLYIETVPKTGYRLIAPVEPIETTDPPPIKSTLMGPLAPSIVTFFRSGWPWLLIGISALAFWLINA